MNREKYQKEMWCSNKEKRDFRDDDLRGKGICVVIPTGNMRDTKEFAKFLKKSIWYSYLGIYDDVSPHNIKGIKIVEDIDWIKRRKI
jgi:hypothetical protein